MIRVRFAPSPTGHLHVGGARTAIFNWLFAKHHGGTFIIRVEDTDQARSTAESETMVLDDLRWLGLLWDEGPDVGGPHAPYRQSERVSRYGEIAHAFVQRGIAYRCYCTEEELEAKRKVAEVAGRPPHYDLTCWLNRREDDALPHAIRFHVPEDGDVTIDDAIRGEVTWKRESLGDFILVRSDGLPTYNFSVVVDDHDMEITDVIRAEEHLTNTHRQVLIYRAMDWLIPHFAHVSLILGQDRTKLSKRHGATSVAAYAEAGFLADAMVNYLALLGWSAPDGRDVFDREYAITNFELDRVNSAPAVFDPQKFEWLNGQYIHAMTAAALRPLVAKAIGMDPPWLEEAIDVVKTSVHLLPQFREAIRFVTDYQPEAVRLLPQFREAIRIVTDYQPDAVYAKLDPNVRSVMDIVAAYLRDHKISNTEAYQAFVDAMKRQTGLKGRALFSTLRLALTGEEHGPELLRALPLIQHASDVDEDVWSLVDRAEDLAQQFNE